MVFRMMRISLCILLAALGSALLGCSNETQTPRTDQIEGATEQPAERQPDEEAATAVAAPELSPHAVSEPQSPERANEEDMDLPFAERVAASDNLIDLYNLIRQAKSSDAKPTAEEEKIAEKKWKSLIEKSPGVSEMAPEADLVEFFYKAPAEEGRRYAFSILFRLNKEFDKNRGIDVKGYVDPSHIRFLPESMREIGFLSAGREPVPPTTKWFDKALQIAGDRYILVPLDLQAREIPYNIQVSFYLNEDNAKFARYGEVVNLGWLFDPIT